jgi:phosphoenolpyruvate---glycerone phosphotransferase subunit DhaK
MVRLLDYPHCAWEVHMKKLMNSPETILSESLAGFCRANADIVSLEGGGKFVRRRSPNPDKVALISGGGSGHEPLHAGFVGTGMLDAACPGQVFTSPTPDQMLAAMHAVSGGAGTLFIVKNYEGDVMNFDMAAEMAGGPVAKVLTNDDVAVDGSLYTTGRRGVAGTLIVEKIVGAAAERGQDLAACKALGDRVNGQTRSMGIALSSCTRRCFGTVLPSAGERLRGHTGDGTLSHVPKPTRCYRANGAHHRPLIGWQLCDVS